MLALQQSKGTNSGRSRLFCYDNNFIAVASRQMDCFAGAHSDAKYGNGNEAMRFFGPFCPQKELLTRA